MITLCNPDGTASAVYPCFILSSHNGQCHLLPGATSICHPFLSRKCAAQAAAEASAADGSALAAARAAAAAAGRRAEQSEEEASAARSAAEEALRASEALAAELDAAREREDSLQARWLSLP